MALGEVLRFSILPRLLDGCIPLIVEYIQRYGIYAIPCLEFLEAEELRGKWEIPAAVPRFVGGDFFSPEPNWDVFPAGEVKSSEEERSDESDKHWNNQKAFHFKSP
jgi:hypothetical protein